MKSVPFITAALAATALFAVSASPASAASACRKACDKTYGQCMKAERATCLPSWHKCKKACPGATPTARTAKPAATPVVSRTHASPRVASN